MKKSIILLFLVGSISGSNAQESGLQSKEIASAPELFLHQTWFPDQNVITEHITTIKDKSAL
jgi:hypothetical protein